MLVERGVPVADVVRALTVDKGFEEEGGEGGGNDDVAENEDKGAIGVGEVPLFPLDTSPRVIQGKKIPIASRVALTTRGSLKLSAAKG